MKRDNGHGNPVSHDERKEWANYIGRGRVSRGWSQKELAARTGYSKEVVQKLENGDGCGRTAASHLMWAVCH